MILNIDTIFKKLCNEIIEEVIVRDAYINYAEDKLALINNCSKWKLKTDSEYSSPQDC